MWLSALGDLISTERVGKFAIVEGIKIIYVEISRLEYGSNLMLYGEQIVKNICFLNKTFI